MYKNLFTSESVTEGHPDKICDAIADAVLDAILENDKHSRIACEVAISTGLVLVMGELTTSHYADIASIARKTINRIGYNSPKWGFNGNTCAVINAVTEQSADIAQAVNKNDSLGAGDQGMMFGFACRDTENNMPLPISLSHSLAKKLAEVRKNNTIPYLGPDGKTQVTIEYDKNNNPLRVDTIVVSSQHSEDVSLTTLKNDIIEKVIKTTVPEKLLDASTRFLINPSGRFIIGGPVADTGLTGRKIIVDTYGGYANHGGGSFSGKDPTKVDRTGAYAARYVAKNLVLAGLLDKVEIQIAYAIGVAKPVSIQINDFGTAKIPISKIVDAVNDCFDFEPKSIIERFQLLNPIYRQLSSYGHFGRTDLDLPWEKDDLSKDLKKYKR